MHDRPRVTGFTGEWRGTRPISRPCCFARTTAWRGRHGLVTRTHGARGQVSIDDVGHAKGCILDERTTLTIVLCKLSAEKPQWEDTPEPARVRTTPARPRPPQSPPSSQPPRTARRARTQLSATVSDFPPDLDLVWLPVWIPAWLGQLRTRAIVLTRLPQAHHRVQRCSTSGTRHVRGRPGCESGSSAGTRKSQPVCGLICS